MGKVGVNVGEDFPAEEVNRPEGEPDEDRGDRDCDHDEWHRRRDERRARARAFHNDIRRAVHKHFGHHSYTAHNAHMLRVLLGVSALVLLVALIPHLVLLGILLACVAVFALALARHHDHGYGAPHGDPNV